MADNFTRTRFDRLFNVEHIITIFYMELSKSFYHDEEQHDFWEIVYIDKGEMLCSANGNRYILKSGEMTFHKPHESHTLTGINDIASNVSILTFQCNSRAMKHFEGKIFRLNAEEKSLLAELFSEGLSCYQLMDARNPLLQKLKKVTPSPLGSSQMTKNLLEIFLIKLCRNTDVVTKKMRRSYMIDGVDVPYEIKKLLDYLQEHIYSNVTIGELARHLDKSESAVKQLFARFRDGGIIKYYTELKIKEARKLIREGSYNMTQISDMLQFDTPQYFSKCFKRVTNMTPTEYKDSILK